MSNNHANKLLEDVLEAAYRDHVRMIISKAIEQYLLGQTQDDYIRRMHVGLQRLYEIHTILAKEIAK